MAHYPLHLESRLDPPLSRWRWLVKWLLAIPHYVVLFFLAIGAFVATLAALVAIVVTGRYPRALFDYNVGVLRWSWRVDHYAFGALGTDRYPPFTLADDADYPARLDVEYPERLSRGLALVKWLLAIPHLVVVGLLTSGGRSAMESAFSGGVVGVLAFVAGVILLVTGSYPPALYDVLIGLNRWVYRVYAYLALMTDKYPPFRFDPGGPEPE
jgi:hypothetical protein